MSISWAVAAISIPLMLVAPAIWNGYPLLQYDTGGYLARWYEGYLVPSRSTVFGIYLHLGTHWDFWLNLGLQALATMWIVQLTLRVFGMTRAIQVAGVVAALTLTTALPWLASMLLTDIFAGLAVLALFLLVSQNRRLGVWQKVALFVFTAFSGATHSATLGVLAGLCLAGWLLWPVMRNRLPVRGLLQGTLTIPAGAAMLLAANFALSGQLAWTPGASGVTFGRMLQDGIVAKYLNDHCDQQKLKLCPYRNQLPATADDFLWGKSMFNDLGRFNGLGDEMAFIAREALFAYPVLQAEMAAKAAAEQLVLVATGEGSHNWIAHTYGIFETYLPDHVPAMRAARQQKWEFNFDGVNAIHVPVAYASMLLLFAVMTLAAIRRRMDDLTLLAGWVVLALLGNAIICGVFSGPHDRYGARMVWIATFVVIIAAIREAGGLITAARRSAP